MSILCLCLCTINTYVHRYLNKIPTVVGTKNAVHSFIHPSFYHYISEKGLNIGDPIEGETIVTFVQLLLSSYNRLFIRYIIRHLHHHGVIIFGEDSRNLPIVFGFGPVSSCPEDR